MNWAEIKDPFSIPDSLTLGVAGSNPFTVMTNIFVTEFTIFSEIFRKNSIGSIGDPA